MPTVHVFRAGSSDTVGYTLDPKGSNLPRGIVRGAWKQLGAVEVGADSPRRDPPPRSGCEADAALVREALERDGFYVAVGGIDLPSAA
jgi:hypothetical protein